MLIHELDSWAKARICPGWRFTGCSLDSFWSCRAVIWKRKRLRVWFCILWVSLDTLWCSYMCFCILWFCLNDLLCSCIDSASFGSVLTICGAATFAFASFESAWTIYGAACQICLYGHAWGLPETAGQLCENRWQRVRLREWVEISIPPTNIHPNWLCSRSVLICWRGVILASPKLSMYSRSIIGV